MASIEWPQSINFGTMSVMMTLVKRRLVEAVEDSECVDVRHGRA
jgi:hypothetical protein